MKQARELAEAAAEAARRDADEARARAERLSDEADAQAAVAKSKVDEAKSKVDEVNERRAAVISDGKKLGKDADKGPLDLDKMTKEELLALGAEMDLNLKSAKRKQDIVRIIRRSRS